jgi:hypothetical protein
MRLIVIFSIPLLLLLAGLFFLVHVLQGAHMLGG